IRAGKCLATTTTEVLVTLRRPPLSRLCPGDTNYVRFRLSPDVTIAIGARVKRPGEQMDTEPTELRVVHHPDAEEMDAYERLLGEAMEGDPTLFAREDAVEAAWAIVQPILGSTTRVYEYECRGWVGFDFQRAFGRPVRVTNDAAMQALGSYRHGRMLFLGFGTGLGSAMIIDGVLEPMELAHLPYKNGRTYEDYVGVRGLERFG